MQQALDAADLPDGVSYSFAGEAQDQTEAMVFLVGAFVSAIVLMLVILVLQFNSFYQAFVVMSAIIFSVAGVLLGLIVTGRPFGVVMGGIGIIALAGIVVNNNIVLIDTYNDLRSTGMHPREAALRRFLMRSPMTQRWQEERVAGSASRRRTAFATRFLGTSAWFQSPRSS